MYVEGTFFAKTQLRERASRRQVEPVVARVAADFDDSGGDRMVPVWTPGERNEGPGKGQGQSLLEWVRVRAY